MDNKKRDVVVEEVVELLCSRCSTPIEMIDVLVPVVAAALWRVKTQPQDIPKFFFRVTGLLDKADREGKI